MNPALLSARGVVAHRGRTEVLHGVDLDLRAGEVVVLLGPNGSGKSTLVDVLGGLLGASAGTVERRGRVATVMQDAGLARRSAHDNVVLALSWWGVSRARRHGLADEALARLGVSHLGPRAARALSGGERRRVHLARGLAVGPDVLLLDEPFSGLDPATHAVLRDDVAAALRADDRAVLVVLHDRDDAWALADRLLVLIDGRVAAEGRPQDLLRTPGSPEVARLLGYDGELRLPGRLVLTRAAAVLLDADGDHEGVLARIVPTQDGARVQVHLDAGDVWAVARAGWPAAGERVRVRFAEQVEFPLTSPSG